MKRIFAAVLSLALLLALLAGCASDPAPSGAASDLPPASTAAPAPATTDAPTTAVPTEPAHMNEKGPFDEEHYRIGLRALLALDSYFDGKLTASEVDRALSSCYDEISSLPELSESDPLYAGNDFVRSYVFLAKIDFDLQMSDFATKKYEDRNYLAAALGEPEKDYSSSSFYAVDSYLSGLFSDMEEKFPDNTFLHAWRDGDLYIFLMIPDLDYCYENKDSLTAADRSAMKEVSHGYVAGSFAESIYNAVRKVGGEGFDVFIGIANEDGVTYCASKNLEIFIDSLDE